MLKLRHFDLDAEFVRSINVEGRSITTDWAGYYSQDTLRQLDELREQWGDKIRLSPNPYALGRKSGASQHNVLLYAPLTAADIMPAGIRTKRDVRHFEDLAESLGFTGIGFYPDWRPMPGFHIDRRPNRARWGAYLRDGAQVYTTFEEAVRRFG